MEQIIASLKEPLAQVEEQLTEALMSDDWTVNQVFRSLPATGGKRIRPILVLLSAGCFKSELGRAIRLAVCAELLHTATLVHDDVVDNSPLRRGQSTLHSRWDNKVAVLAGDRIFGRAFDLLVEVGEMQVMRAMSGMISGMGEGEIMQIMHAYDSDVSEEQYFERIKRKTALFFSSCCQIGALTAGATEREVKALADFGLKIGIAFQLTDDLLDYVGSEERIGKPVDNDLLEGNLTLPVIYTLRHAPNSAELRRLIASSKLLPEDVDRIVRQVRANGSLEYARQAARKHIDAALRDLMEIPDCASCQQLGALAEYVVSRKL